MIRLFIFNARRAMLTIFALAFPVVGACSEDPSFATVSWQVRCGDAMGCPTNDPPRAIDAVDGEDGVSVLCALRDLEGGRQVFFFSATRGNDFGIELRNATFPEGGGTVLGTCEVTVIEDAVRFQGACGAGVPSEMVPCQVQDLEAGSVITGSILCRNLPSTTRTIRRDVAASGTGNQDSPVRFEVGNCER